MSSVSASTPSIHTYMDTTKQLSLLPQLIQQGGNPNEVNEKGECPLHRTDVILQCPFPSIPLALLIGAKANVNAQTPHGHTPLNCMVAPLGHHFSDEKKLGTISNTHPELVQLLLNAKADPNIADNVNPDIPECSKWTPLHHVCVSGFTNLLTHTQLLQRANVNAQTDAGDTPLNLTIKDFHKGKIPTQVVDLLIQSRADVNKPDNTGHTPFTNAALSHYPKVRQLLPRLFEAGARIPQGLSEANLAKIRPIYEARGNSSLHQCINTLELDQANASDWAPVFTSLLRQGADPNEINDKGQIPLHRTDILLKCADSLEIFKLLIAAKADVNKEDSNGSTPIKNAIVPEGTPFDHLNEGYKRVCLANAHPELLQLLLDAKADPNALSDRKHKWTVLHNACAYGSTNLVAVLLDKKANIDPLTKGRETPLHTAVKHDGLLNQLSIEVVQLLIARKAGVNVRDNDNHTPLSRAASNKVLNVQLLSILIKAGAKMPRTLPRGLHELDLTVLRQRCEQACAANGLDESDDSGKAKASANE